ncbi:hypothetical protein TEA_023218 [Camellia sinensis var. sinensis]|uniref:Uncharacterized protein n=1 Tax=Camellia sinensis var. sinensis TaxID=542762 RepID=A0A4S4D426_CAMSN|nr:hypothetical protein TEA_023218 [Camellia sinensis var. sinensis]
MADLVSSIDNPLMISKTHVVSVSSLSTPKILPLSQRSKECPICWQLLVLKDPSSQELLAAVENERNLRSRRNARHIREDYEMNIANSYGDDSDFNERIMRHFAAAARRARYVERRERPRSSGIGPPLVLLSVPTGDLPLPDVQHLRTTSPEERQTSSYEFSEGDSPTFSTLRSVVPEVVNVEPNSVGNRDRCNKPRVLCSSESPQRPSSSEFLAFLESVKLKFSAASARYKESISKSIAGVAQMIERLDLPSKRTGISVPLSSCSTSNFSYKGKDTQESVITQSPNENAGESVHDMSSPESPRGHSTFPSELDISLVQIDWRLIVYLPLDWSLEDSLEGDVVEMRTSAQLWVPHFILPMKAFTICRTIRNQSRRIRK